MSIPEKTRKTIWALSGNRCAFPGCNKELFMAEGDAQSLIGEECHICARNAGGSRFNSLMTDSEINDCSNLILLCSVHHKLIDDNPDVYTVDVLREMKANHEERVRSALETYHATHLLSHQVFNIDGFICSYDRNEFNAPLDSVFRFREGELAELTDSIGKNKVTIISGAPGIGKTRLAIEACRKYQEEGWKVYCVKSIGFSLQNDLECYLEQNVDTILFLDDANNVESLGQVLDLVSALDLGGYVHILMTVRDYAKADVIKAIREHHHYYEIVITGFSVDEIKSILKEDYNVNNYDYLKQIIKIAKGNIRLAVMAALKSLDSGYAAISSAADIFKIFYEPVIDKAHLNKDGLIFLCIISITGPVDYKTSKLYNDLIVKYIPQANYDELIEILEENEFIDFIKSRVIKVSDQSFGDYIKYHVIYRKQWINLEDLILTEFPVHKKEILGTVEGLVTVFQELDVIGFVRKRIVSAWDKSDPKSNKAYLMSFYTADPVKALVQMKHYADGLTPADFDVDSIDFDRETKTGWIATDELEILAGFSTTEHYDSAVELILDIYAKRPDLVADVFHALTNNAFARNADYNGFRNENIVLDSLWKRCRGSEDYNFTFMLLHVIPKLLQTEPSMIEYLYDNTYNYVTRYVIPSEALLSLRRKIIEILCKLYDDCRYHELASKILMGLHYGGRGNGTALQIIKSDLNEVWNGILSTRSLGLEEALILHNFKQQLAFHGDEVDERFDLLNDCYEYTVYELLRRDRHLEMSIEEEISRHKEAIVVATEGYATDDYDRMFAACREIIRITRSDGYAISQGISLLFELHEGGREYLQIADVYMKNGAPGFNYQIRIVPALVNDFGYEEALKISRECPTDIGRRVKLSIYECIDEAALTAEIAAAFATFQRSELQQDVPHILYLPQMTKYLKYDNEILWNITEYLLKTPKYICSLFGQAITEEIATVIDATYDSKPELLEELYFAGFVQTSMGHNMDYSGFLFRRILRRSPQKVWERYIDSIRNGAGTQDGYENVFSWIWREYYSFERIDYAYTHLIEGGSVLSKEKIMKLFPKAEFDNGHGDGPSIEANLKSWFDEKLNRCLDPVDIDAVDLLISTALSVRSDLGIDLILQFISKDMSITDFNKLFLFPEYDVIVGSEVPTIDKRIETLRALDQKLTGIEYLEHKASIAERIKKLEKYRENVELKEQLVKK